MAERSGTDWLVDVAIVTEHWHGVHEHLAEALATAHSREQEGAPEGLVGPLLDAMLALWQLRWDLPPLPERSESAAGGDAP